MCLHSGKSLAVIAKKSVVKKRKAVLLLIAKKVKVVTHDDAMSVSHETSRIVAPMIGTRISARNLGRISARNLGRTATSRGTSVISVAIRTNAESAIHGGIGTSGGTGTSGGRRTTVVIATNGAINGTTNASNASRSVSTRSWSPKACWN